MTSSVQAVAESRPLITVARDVERHRSLDKILKEADALSEYARIVVVVPKDLKLAECLEQVKPEVSPRFQRSNSIRRDADSSEAFSPTSSFVSGRPDIQRALAARMAGP